MLIGAGEDDVAAWRAADGSVTVATCDTFVEGRHFDLGWMPPDTAGWRACALTLSDLAAKAAEPTFALVALTAPPESDAETVQGIYAGLDECARWYGLRLLGGDTTAGDSLSVTVFALGRADVQTLRPPRSAVKPGWTIGVTGPLGAEAAALAQRRPTRPRPLFRSRLGYVAAGDVSDGLLRELAKFRQAAGVGASIRSEAIPVAEGATLEQALTGGEEVELVCGWPSGERDLVVVGEFTADRRILVDGVEHEGGYDHFA